MGSTPWYATREMLASAADTQPSAAANRALDGILAAATDSVNSLLVRPLGLWPTVTTHRFDFPSSPRSRAWRLWLEERTLAGAPTAIVSGGVAIDPGDVLLYPEAGPPYDQIQLNRGTSVTLGGGDTSQQDVAITGPFGHRIDEITPGVLAAAVASTSAQTITVDAATAAEAGVGSLLRAGTERMIVQSRSWSATGDALDASGLASQNSAREIALADTTGYSAGETLIVGAERVRVLEVLPAALIVERGVGGLIQAHSAGSALFAQRTLLVLRGALGTTAAVHSQGDGVAVWQPPALATSLCLAEALNTGAQRLSAYARTAGSGDNAQEYAGRALADIRKDARRQLGRRSRISAV